MAWAVSCGMPGISASMYCRSVSSTAAAIGPASEPVPPSTAMARKVIEAASVKTLGETKPTTLA